MPSVGLDVRFGGARQRMPPPGRGVRLPGPWDGQCRGREQQELRRLWAHCRDMGRGRGMVDSAQASSALARSDRDARAARKAPRRTVASASAGFLKLVPFPHGSPMTRRFQFSLRGLLGVAVAVCLVLGGWKLFRSFQQYITVTRDPSTDLVRVEGQIIRFLGPPEIQYDACLGVVRHDGHAGAKVGSWISERRWLCVYPIAVETDVLASEFSRATASVFIEEEEIESGSVEWK